ncbi:hypothetical protein FB45DRAFT_1018193 [Roridomyces roridus]|uniref:Uncharacterized protein n=1 Tax=Roridomyces roridus TaxID=1738132 RepID=A0AAD7FYX7_9AGAR|nr:hypothetical protein FB45DRAFT_1018193 [Roridomyces roridus]
MSILFCSLEPIFRPFLFTYSAVIVASDRAHVLLQPLRYRYSKDIKVHPLLPISPVRFAYKPLARPPTSTHPAHPHPPALMDAFTTIISTKVEDVVVALPPVSDDSSSGTSGQCVVCKEDTSLPSINEDSSSGTSGQCVIA